MMSQAGLIVLAVVLASCVIFSVYNAIVSIVWSIRQKSWLAASRAAYPLAVAAAAGFMLDRIQFKLTGLNGIDDLLIIVIGIFIFVATIVRTIAIVAHKDNQ